MRRQCDQEQKIVSALIGGAAGEDFADHLRHCDRCRDAVTAATWLRGVAVETERSAVLPEADAIWWRAQVVQRLCDQEARSERRARPLFAAQLGAAVIAVVTLAALSLTSESASILIGGLSGLLGGSSAAILALASIASMLTGGIVAWQVARELG